MRLSAPRCKNSYQRIVEVGKKSSGDNLSWTRIPPKIETSAKCRPITVKPLGLETSKETN